MIMAKLQASIEIELLFPPEYYQVIAHQLVKVLANLPIIRLNP